MIRRRRKVTFRKANQPAAILVDAPLALADDLAAK
jgi:hypothetical protein